MAIATGEPAGMFTFSTEYDNGEAWGEIGDAVNADAEFQAFIARVSSPDAPSEILQFTTASEIPLRENNPTLGNVIEAHVTRPLPGKFEEGLAQASRVCELVEQHGATNARLWQMGYAGLGSGLQMMAWECADLRTQGRLQDAWGSVPEMAEIAMKYRFGTEMTATSVFDGLYQVVPI